ncbi:secreted RxLR effector protein 161-like [Lucilia sericata]|uniref:secreted RxLR effector protein 161-like n=1 Tax=Lucilia sericata TaxID=13632 RepID=UPI0018A828E1|nr:secreted RxLR effector protein 161-like [Lucilia sericata]XP_037818292.1 secreted RxLR effector protein 161-like [Lucilia sericata]
MKDIGPVKRCLGIDFDQNLKTNQVFLSQQKYAEVILERFGMADFKPVSTPLVINCGLTCPKVKDEKEMSEYPYQRLIGALMYLTVTTRPDIAYAVNYLSQFNSNYTEEHWKAAKRILRFIRGTIDYGLLYNKTNLKLYGVVDADWGANIEDRRSYSGFAFLLAGAAISWEALFPYQAPKQNI